jgi:hypothetical protein
MPPPKFPELFAVNLLSVDSFKILRVRPFVTDNCEPNAYGEPSI